MLDFLTRKPQLSAGGSFGQFAITKQLGAGIDFVWPCTNSGDAEGVAFIKVREPATGLIWDGAPFPIPAGQTGDTNLHQTIDLPLGLHSMIPELHEGLPPDGIRVIAQDTLALTVVSSPVLAPVGLPKINNLDGPTFFIVKTRSVIPISWSCQNSGGGLGKARLRLFSPGSGPFGDFTSLINIPGNSTVTILFTQTAWSTPNALNYVLNMEDDAFVILGTWQYTIQTVL